MHYLHNPDSFISVNSVYESTLGRELKFDILNFVEKMPAIKPVVET